MSEAQKDGGAAFPSPEIRGPDGTGFCAPEYGMSLRDWFAGQAIQAAWEGFNEGRYDGDNSTIAACAYQIADAMLAARSAGRSAL